MPEVQFGYTGVVGDVTYSVATTQCCGRWSCRLACQLRCHQQHQYSQVSTVFFLCDERIQYFYVKLVPFIPLVRLSHNN